MQALTFWKTVAMDQANLLERLFALLDQHGIRYCVSGGQAVNAYAEPPVSLDLVISVQQIEEAEQLLADAFTVKPYQERPYGSRRSHFRHRPVRRPDRRPPGLGL